MPPTKIVLLACGSFNPPTNMHLRMFEVARDHLHRLGQYEVAGGLISPVHDAYAKNDLVSVTHRITMLDLALQSSEWVKVSRWESRQETWTRTRIILQHHQNKINSFISDKKFSVNNINEDDDLDWLPHILRDCSDEIVQVKLLCGADLLQSFATPGLWSDEDIEAIVGRHGLIVITRDNTDPLKFIYNSDILTKFLRNIVVVNEWIRNEISSTKVRRALRRSESVRYIIPDKVIDYIHKHSLYGTIDTKYLLPPNLQFQSNFLTPSPSDTVILTPSPTWTVSNPANHNVLRIDCVDTITKSKNVVNVSKQHPGQAVKVIAENDGHHTVVTNEKKASLKRPACLL